MTKISRFFLIIFIITLICLKTSCGVTAQNSYAEGGILDISNWDFDQQGVVNLRGEWFFYWNKLLMPDSTGMISHTPDTVMYIPGNWTSLTYENANLPYAGNATAVLRVILPKKRSSLQLYTYNPVASMECYANRKKICTLRDIDKSAKGIDNNFDYESLPFDCHADTLVLVIRASNQYHQQGAFSEAVYLGSAKAIYKYEKQRDLQTNFFLGAFFLMSIFHFVLFVLRQRDKTALFFFVAVLGFIMFFALSSKDIMFLTSNISLNSILKIAILAQGLVYLGIFSFIYELFSNDFNKTVFKVIFVISVLHILGIFLPLSVLGSQIFAYLTQIFVLSSTGYAVWVLVLAYIRKREDSGKFLIGVSIFIISMINDTLLNMNIIQSFTSTQYGLFGFFMVQSIIISARFSRAFERSESLTNELRELNENLEERVQDRTQMIEEQKEELETQHEKLIELDKFKQGMTSMIIHDLKNPLNSILALTEQTANKDLIKINLVEKEQIIHQSGHEMLRMVLNLLDVNRFEETKVNLNITTVNAYKMLEEAYNNVKFLCEQKSVTVKIIANKNISTFADAEIVVRVLINLLTNALKFSGIDSEIVIGAIVANEKSKLPGEINLKQILAANETGCAVIFYVKDQGEGIPKDKQTIIFQKFSQLKPRKSGGAASTGIGLSFCKLAVEAHNQFIGVISEQQSGSIFWFSMPCCDTDNSDKADKIIFGIQEEFITFSDEEKKILCKFIPRLKQLKYYEVTNIKLLLNEIDANTIVTIEKWKKLVYKAITTSNEKLYEKLLEI